MKLKELQETNKTLSASQVKQLLQIVAKQARLAKREKATGFKRS